MVDRLMPVGSQGSRWQAELPVEVDGRGEGEDARGDAADQSVRGSREMALQAELSLSELTIDSMRWRMRPIGGELRSGSFARLGLRSSPPKLGHGVLEVGAGEALVGNHELAGGRMAFEQLEHGLALACVGGDEVEVAHTAVRRAAEHEPHAQ
jgi:hypothetical protein